MNVKDKPELPMAPVVAPPPASKRPEPLRTLPEQSADTDAAASPAKVKA